MLYLYDIENVITLSRTSASYIIPLPTDLEDIAERLPQPYISALSQPEAANLNSAQSINPQQRAVFPYSLPSHVTSFSHLRHLRRLKELSSNSPTPLFGLDHHRHSSSPARENSNGHRCHLTPVNETFFIPRDVLQGWLSWSCCRSSKCLSKSLTIEYLGMVSKGGGEYTRPECDRVTT